jgi:hypothetical protein
MKSWKPVVLGCALVGLAAVLVSQRDSATVDEDFYVKPYVQLGDNAKLVEPESEEILWFTRSPQRRWQLEIKQDGGEWTSVPVKLRSKRVFNGPVNPLYQFTCSIKDLEPGAIFDYRVLADGKPVFAAWAKVRKPFTKPFVCDIFGDCGSGSLGEKLVAWQCYQQPMPDLVVIPGDIVYPSGLFSEYMRYFFPVYNHDAVDQLRGVPLMRSIPFMGVLGNHDIGQETSYPVNLDKHPDGLAYFAVWRPPLNGPQTKPDVPDIPRFKGSESASKLFLQSVGDQYPRTGMYSFDYGNSHWLILDGNFYMHWTNPVLRRWVENDLNGSKATWKFVSFHQPGFSCDVHHWQEQRMRLLSDIFQRCGVDIIFAGHAHDYQRTHPLRFTAKLKDGQLFVNGDGSVSGDIALDSRFDGEKVTVPNGVIEVVTGAGGAPLYPERRQFASGVGDRDVIDRFMSSTHSFSRCKIDGDKFELWQIDTNGECIDHFIVTKK